MLKLAGFAGRFAGPAAVCLVLALSGCTTTETQGMASAPLAGVIPPAGAIPTAGASAALIASGGELFQASSCIFCHGEDAKGTAVGPNLTDANWLTGDGSVEAIGKIISEGVDAPKQFRSPMPAMGGANLSDEDIKAVAAYVWSLSHT